MYFLNTKLQIRINFKNYLPIVLHSMCHPGLPWPHGHFQDGSSLFAAFHKAKSNADFLSGCAVSGKGVDSLPYLMYLLVSK